MGREPKGGVAFENPVEGRDQGWPSESHLDYRLNTGGRAKARLPTDRKAQHPLEGKDTMTNDEFKAWRKHMGYSRAEAARMLGVSSGSVELYERGRRREDERPVVIPKPVELACAALALGMTSYSGPQT